MDYWGDAAQICTAVGGAFAGVFTVGVAIYGRKLWQATSALSAETTKLGAATVKLHEVTQSLVDQAARTNTLAEQAAELDIHARLRPALQVWIDYDSGDLATLFVRHATHSESPYIGMLTPEIGTSFDTGEPDVGMPIKGPWRFKQGTDGADEFGRTARSAAALERGVLTRWLLSRQTDDIGRGLPPWDSRPEEDGPCLVRLTATIGEQTWRYSVLLAANETQQL